MVHKNGMLPIRKIDPITVALSSYYGKTFVAVSAKKANSSVEWIIKKLNESLLKEEGVIKNVINANVYNNEFKAPWIYNSLAANFKTIQTFEYTLEFNRDDIIKVFPEPKPGSKMLSQEAQASNYESQFKGRIAGFSKKGEYVIVTYDNEFHLVQNNQLVHLGSIYDLLHLEEVQCPVDFAELRIFSKTIPIGVVMGYFIGFSRLLKLLEVEYRTVEGRGQKNLKNDEYSITFKDRSYIFSRKNKYQSLIISGFLDYEKQLKQYNSAEFNTKDVYLNLLSSKQLGAIYIRELESSNDLFVDPITKSILMEMKEPTTYQGLLLRSVEMLTNYNSPISQDMTCMRIRGYERIAGVIYKELAMSIRQYRSKNIAGKSKIDISPYQIWNTFLGDQSIKIVEDINPIQNLKEREVVTFVGEGGRNKDSMNKPSRAYHTSDMGVISEATVDSSDVGVNAFLSANPNILSHRGLTVPRDKPNDLTNLLSTTALLAPCSINDD